MERVNEFDKSFPKGDSGVKYLFRGPNIDWGILVLKPGESLGKHGHTEVEETFYFPDSAPRFYINDTPHRIKPGDAFRIEPTESHNIVNDTEQPIEIIFIKHIYRPEDKITY
ncbi:MAG: cupin domain-containing protein [bacterium]|nr:cupin domain-containing protein [bacterium]